MRHVILFSVGVLQHVIYCGDYEELTITVMHFFTLEGRKDPELCLFSF